MSTILIVDDDLYIRDVYQEVLTEAGYKVEIAIDGKEGYEKILDGGYDLVLLDVMMPYLDGIGVLTKLKDQKSNKKNGKIVILTNLAHDLIAEEAAKNGAYICLNKASMNPDQLLDKVKELLK